MADSGITHDEWRAAVAEARATAVVDDPTCQTVRELGDVFGFTYGHAGRVVAQLVKQGKAERVSKMIQTPVGPRRVAAYRLVKPVGLVKPVKPVKPVKSVKSSRRKGKATR